MNYSTAKCRSLREFALRPSPTLQWTDAGPERLRASLRTPLSRRKYKWTSKICRRPLARLRGSATRSYQANETHVWILCPTFACSISFTTDYVSRSAYRNPSQLYPCYATLYIYIYIYTFRTMDSNVITLRHGVRNEATRRDTSQAWISSDLTPLRHRSIHLRPTHPPSTPAAAAVQTTCNSLAVRCHMDRKVVH